MRYKRYELAAILRIRKRPDVPVAIVILPKEDTADIVIVPDAVFITEKSNPISLALQLINESKVAYEGIVTVFELKRFDEQQFNEALPKLKQILESYQSVGVNKKANNK